VRGYCNIRYITAGYAPHLSADDCHRCLHCFSVRFAFHRSQATDLSCDDTTSLYTFRPFANRPHCIVRNVYAIRIAMYGVRKVNAIGDIVIYSVLVHVFDLSSSVCKSVGYYIIMYLRCASIILGFDRRRSPCVPLREYVSLYQDHPTRYIICVCVCVCVSKSLGRAQGR